MYSSAVDSFADIGVQKVKALNNNLIAFLIGAAMAGAYVGFGGIVMFSVGGHLGPEWARLIMGAVFASALTIIIFAGGELFTGAVMFMSFAALRNKVRVSEVLSVWAACWIGNLIGAILLALLLEMAGGGVLLGDGAEVFYKVVSAKMSASGAQLFARGLLCNWLVCLAIWMCGRTKSEAAKLGLIFWPVMLFASSGFEHSVANMFIFAIALLGPEHVHVSLAGAVHNIFWVTLGNIAGGALMISIGYWMQSAGAGSVVRPVIATATGRAASDEIGAESLKNR
jgi:nitrite transporter NirC